MKPECKLFQFQIYLELGGKKRLNVKIIITPTGVNVFAGPWKISRSTLFTRFITTRFNGYSVLPITSPMTSI